MDVLVQDVRETAAAQESTMFVREVMRDGSDLAPEPGLCQRLHHARAAGADVVDAGHAVALHIVCQVPQQGLGGAGIVGGQVGYAHHAQLREALFDDLRKADAAFDLGGHARGLRRQQQRVAGAGACHPGQQQAGRAPGGTVVWPDVGVAQGSGHVGEQGHDVDACSRQLVDRQLDGRQVGSEQRDAMTVTQLRQCVCERRGIARIDAASDLRDVLVAEVARGLRDLPIDEFQLREFVGRQHIHEAKVLALARTSGLARSAEFLDDLQHALDGLRIDAGAAVEHAVDGSGADTRQSGDFGDLGDGGHADSCV